jgi:asparagine synthase (glutamine-hydrolysing)
MPMSVQFGKWNFSGEPIDWEYLERVKRAISPYGPDQCRAYRSPGIAIEFCAFHTTAESKTEVQPVIAPSGVVVAWDGRLDNRTELAHRLMSELGIRATDVELAAAAYERWGDSCFGQLIGDWAISIWNPGSRSLTLAKDPIGARPLYYRMDSNGITWSSVLDPLILDGKCFGLCEEYVAGWLAFCPPARLTPYIGIQSVLASSLVRLSKDGCVSHKYWDFDPGLGIHYRTDSEYEEHFRQVFSSAVRRRLRSDRPVLAELSGGIDSSAIVCTADGIISQGDAETPRLDTVSYFDDSEPNWNERPFFQKVEETRGRPGHHIDASSPAEFAVDEKQAQLNLVPGSYRRSARLAAELGLMMDAQDHRVLLSGIGGDEVAGGVPTPLPELENLLRLGHLTKLTKQLRLWSLARRQPWLHLLFEACLRFFPSPFAVRPHKRRAPWLDLGFVRRNRLTFVTQDHAIRIFGPLPSFQENMGTLDSLRSQLACASLAPGPLCERRYPFLDRDLLEFLYGVPREQLVRPGQRRSLMRRALAGVVPDEILNRKRKAFVCRSPIKDVATAWSTTRSIANSLQYSSEGIIDSDALGRAVESLASGRDISAPRLMRVIELQLWLKEMGDGGIFPNDVGKDRFHPDEGLLAHLFRKRSSAG